MKAAYISGYGGVDKVEIGEQPKPDVLPGQVRIQMKAGSVNPIDWKTVNGDLKALFKPPFPVMLGSDGAGIVESVGARVSGWQAGDEVFFAVIK